MSQSLLIGTIFMTVIFLSKEKFAFIFTNSDDMIHAASELAYLLGITMVINSVSQTISGDLLGLVNREFCHNFTFVSILSIS